ncbi:hypothetical protein EDD16DRAFT_1145811 [Pisolithus croceorrhizus]|nr:hypothetical protein EDD16DRAFT_1145811 [Pisolithus croceorrhizus]
MYTVRLISRYMINIVTSAIVNTPPPIAVIAMVSTLATKVHKTLHYAQTDETMMPLFTHEPNGTVRSKTNTSWVGGTGVLCGGMAEREKSCSTSALETEKGLGTSVGYEVRVPPPQWAPGP